VLAIDEQLVSENAGGRLLLEQRTASTSGLVLGGEPMIRAF
jgi:hypothetical protein